MDKILDVLKTIEADFAPLDDSFASEVEKRNKLAAEHVAALKAAQVLVAELKKEIQNELIPLHQEAIDKKAEVAAHTARASDILVGLDTKQKANAKVIEDQTLLMQENDIKINRSHTVIEKITRDREAHQEKINNKIGELAQIELKAKSAQSEFDALIAKKTALEDSNSGLANAESDLKARVGRFTSEVAMLQKQVTDLRNK